MNTYLAFYRGRKIEVEATTSYEAQEAAAKRLKARKSYDVVVVLVQRSDGSDVVHIAAD